jgi:hypothetical protein
VPGPEHHDRRVARGQRVVRVDLMTEAWAPVAVDLDASGGFVTPSAHTIESVVLQLLALLPAGYVKVRVIDPIQLGKNADFLHRMGEAAAPIFGNSVVTNLAGFGQLLEELEAHIAYVTQSVSLNSGVGGDLGVSMPRVPGLRRSS